MASKSELLWQQAIDMGDFDYAAELEAERVASTETATIIAAEQYWLGGIANRKPE